MPQVAATDTSQQATAATGHTVDIPAHSNGELLIMCISTNNSAGNRPDPVTWPTGWTEIFDSPGNDVTTENYVAAAYIVSDGTEGPTEAITLNNAHVGSHCVLRIQNHNASTNAPAAGTEVEFVNTTTADPPAVTPGPGNGTYLSIVFSGHWDDTPTVSTWPTNYGGADIVEVAGPVNNDGGGIAITWREATFTTEDPSAITYSVNAFGWVNTIWVQDGTEGAPAAAGGRKGPLGHPLHGPFDGPV